MGGTSDISAGPGVLGITVGVADENSAAAVGTKEGIAVKRVGN